MAALSAVAFIPMVGSVLAKGSKVAVKAARATAKLSSQYVQSAVKALSYTATIGKKADAVSDVGRGLKKGLKSSVDDVVQKAATKTTKAATGAVSTGKVVKESGERISSGSVKLNLQFFASKPSTTKSIKPFEVTTYEDFRNRSIVGDGLEGHELWQHAI